MAMATGVTCGRSAASGPGTASKAGSLVVVFCRPGAPQPRLLLPQPPGNPPPPHLLEKRQLHFRVASCNLVIHQAMIESGKAKPQVMAEHVQSVCGRIVHAGNVDLFFGCKVGGARGGFHKTASPSAGTCTGPSVISTVSMSVTISSQSLGSTVMFLSVRTATRRSLRSMRTATWTLSLHASIYSLAVFLSM